MRFQHVTQAVTLTAFVVLLSLAAYPYPEGATVDFFLRLDPLIGLGTVIAAREIIPSFLPGLIVLVCALFLGRLFCGHICPMGTTLDIMRGPVGAWGKLSRKSASYEDSSTYRSWKYLALVVIVAAALGGISLVHLASPLSLVTRLYALCLYPITLLLGESTLALAGPWISRMGFHDSAFVQIQQKVFATNFFVAALFIGIALLERIRPRFWCRNLCPAGALMALFSRRPLVGREVDEACNRCGLCVKACPVGAISEDPLKTVFSECTVCLRCQELCPETAISFVPMMQGGKDSLVGPDLTRRGVLTALGVGFVTAGLMRTGIKQTRHLGKTRPMVDERLIRPPGSLPEPDLLVRCVRCGECMRACPTNTLQPVWLKAGPDGLFTPAITPRLAACAVNCNVCGKVCPTGAIRDIPLVEKQHAKVGTAWIVRQNCLVWEQDRKCLVCDECCPYNAVAFRPVQGLRNAAPFVLENRCSGCGWCEAKCPVVGASAIRVNVIGEIRLASGSYIEKARQYGLVFKAKDNSMDRLAPDTFDAPGRPRQPGVRPDNRPRPDEDLPPGFITK